ELWRMNGGNVVDDRRPWRMVVDGRRPWRIGRWWSTVDEMVWEK
nr:hypothetical protein [Tanacetum cinerariifolium]